MEANKTILQMKYARIVKLFSEQSGLSLENSLEFFYDSYVYKMVSEGIADMHCRSDGYIAGLLLEEWVLQISTTVLRLIFRTHLHLLSYNNLTAALNINSLTWSEDSFTLQVVQILCLDNIVGNTSDRCCICQEILVCKYKFTSLITLQYT